MMPVMAYARDPISEVWDAAAAAVLRRAVSARGKWVSSRIADYSGEQRAALLAAYGVDIGGPDDAPGGAARTRWARSFVRAVYAAVKDDAKKRGGRRRSVQIEIGRRVPARGIIPAGRAFRIRTHPGGARAAAYMKRAHPGTEGDQGEHWADPGRRSWEE